MPGSNLTPFRKKAVTTKTIRRIGRGVKWAAIVALSFATGHQVPRTMELPDPGVFVVAWTGKNWYKAYCDEGGEFRNENGEVIGQVVKWELP
jgi:hypothetical protein